MITKSQKYTRFMDSADKYFGGFCLYSLALALIAWRRGEAPLTAPLLIGFFPLYNITLSKMLQRFPPKNFQHWDIGLRQIPNSLMVALTVHNLGPALAPWWPIYLCFTLAGVVVCGFGPKPGLTPVLIFYWSLNSILAAVLFGHPEDFYQSAFLAGAIVMIGFVTSNWIAEARKSIDEETAAGAHLQAANFELARLSDEAERTKRLVEKAQAIAQLGYWTLDLSTREFICSNQLMMRLGIEGRAGSITPREYLGLIHPEERADVAARLKSAEAAGGTLDFEYRILGRQNHYLYMHSVVEFDLANHRVFGVVQDVTERVQNSRLIEDQRVQLISAAKLSSLAQMAGGIAHEINTPLGAILMNAEMIVQQNQGQAVPHEVIARRAQAIITISEKIRKIIVGLKQLTKKSGEGLQAISVQSIIDETLELCRERLKNGGIELRQPQRYENLKIAANPTQVAQILLNLLNNAYDAIASQDSRWIEIEATDHGDRIECSVTDSGQGIPAATLDKLFSPFFTTKELGKGMGLGLSISRSIMKQHRGDLTYDRKCANTRFVMTFPKSDPSLKEAV